MNQNFDFENSPNKKITRIKVLIIDDSSLVRNILSKGLSKDPGIEVVGTASDVYQGRDMIVRLRPDVVTLDIEMPRMDGIEFLKHLMPQYPVPVVVVSSLTQKGKDITLQALEYGAVDYVPKPRANLQEGLEEMLVDLATKIKVASVANLSYWKNKKYDEAIKTRTNLTGSQALAESTDKLIAIGASTGGTEAIRTVISQLPPTIPGIVIAQHMPPGFTKTFADRLNELSLINVREAGDDERIINGCAFIAPGDYHLTVVRTGGEYRTRLTKNDKVNGHRPSVDVLFDSVAENVGKNAYGVILTGMGQDGAKGLKRMKEAGAKTFGQDEATSVVYGMPKVANDIGAVDYQLPINEIGKSLVLIIENDRKIFMKGQR
ncbi:MAG TPA: chemotaxis response regulator protein-glutamate methylesterase [Candidatus Kapabacteria bacterium]|nr:chemotaxis response regulator protein-glutamate methylesterase [Candidatus Kapabacteria bacterium]